MKKILMTFAAVFCCLMTMTVLIACSSNEDNPSGDPVMESGIVGSWCTDLTGRTFALWNYGPALNSLTLRADGTGEINTYYIIEEKPIAREHLSFEYVTLGDGQLVMSMDDGEWDYTYRLVDGKLILADGGSGVTYERTDDAMTAKLDEWSKLELEPVPAPARYTVFVYGNAGGHMDNIIEDGFWDKLQPLLKDKGNVRVVCFYKYGKGTNSKYADAGDIVWFELNDETDLNSLRESGLQIHGYGEQAKELKLCNPKTLRMFIEISSLLCPAQEYIFSIWGHGSGFNPFFDIPGKYDLARPATRGVIGDEWNEDEQLDMYELSAAIRESGAVGYLNTILFHNCLMGNLETLAELRDVTDYIMASAHVLSSDGIVLTEFVKGLMESDNTVDAAGKMFKNMRPNWDEQYVDDIEEGENLPNGDYKMIRTDKFDAIFDGAKQLAARLIALYPTQKEAIDRATNRVYRFLTPGGEFDYQVCFFDLADYARVAAEETGDAQLAAISKAIDKAFSDAFVYSADVNWNEQHLDHYTLSVTLFDKKYYTFDWKADGLCFGDRYVLSNIDEGYEQTTFHKLTGWGDWMRINEMHPHGNPTSQGGGPL